jgi:hypothetical protein
MNETSNRETLPLQSLSLSQLLFLDFDCFKSKTEQNQTLTTKQQNYFISIYRF